MSKILSRVLFTITISAVLVCSSRAEEQPTNAGVKPPPFRELGEEGNATSPSSTPATQDDAQDDANDAKEKEKEKVQDKEEGEKKSPPDPWTFYLSASAIYDTNINHDEEDKNAYGRVLGLGMNYRRSKEPYDYEVIYEAFHHEYTENHWDRVSHYLRTSIEKSLSQRWNAEMIGEISLKGSTEDRDLSDQYILLPRLEYRLSRQDRLRFYGAYRIRNFEEDPERDAINRYIGIEFRRKLPGRRSFDIGYRYETNRAESARHHFFRSTYSLEFTTPVAGHDMLMIEAKYRPRKFEQRLVDVGNTEVLRRDRDLILAASLVRPLSRGLDLEFDYKYEKRSSNDVDREYGAHLMIVSLKRRW